MPKELTLIWRFLLTRFRVTILVTLCLFWGGIFAYNNIAKENAPDVEIPAGVIQTFWMGASPQDMEKLVTEKIEKEIKGLENLNKYTSTSLANISIVAVEFDTGTDMIQNFQKLREALDEAKKELPAGILNDPVLHEVKLSDIPVLTLALSGDFSLSQFRDIAENLQSDIEGINQVKEARISGIPETKIHIFVDPQKLEKLNLSIEEISQKIQAHHQDIPLGAIFVREKKIDIRVLSEFQSVSDLMNFPIAQRQGQTIFLGEISQIRREFEEMEVENFFTEGEKAKRSVSIDVIKTVEKTNIFEIIDNIFTLIETQKKENILPSGLEISVIFDGSTDIKESLSRLLESGTQTLVLIGIILFFTLGPRASILSFLVIPLSILMSIAVLFLMGETFNFLSLFALVLAIGLLVDNAIIITEGISENIFNKRLSPMAASVRAIKHFRWPIITGTFTTIFAFFPMILVISGVSGDYISIIPKTITIVLLCSIFVSLFLLPVFAEKLFEYFPPKAHGESARLTKWKHWYGEKMSIVLGANETKKQKPFIGFILSMALGLLIFAVALFPLKQIFVEVFPTKDGNYFTVSLEMPKGTKREETKKLMAPVESVLENYFKVEEGKEKILKNAAFSVGQLSSFDPTIQQNGGMITPEPEILGITVNLVDTNYRKTPSYQIAQKVKQDIQAVVPDFVEVKVSEIGSGPPTGSSPVEVRFIGEDLSHLEELVQEFKAQLATIKLKNGARLKNITDNQGTRLPQIVYEFDRQKMEYFGITPTQIFQTLRSAVEGAKIIEITEGSDEVDVEIRLDFKGTEVWGNPESVEAIAQIPIRTKQGTSIKLEAITTFKITSELTTIRHREGKRSIVVGAYIDGNATAAQFMPQVNESLKKLEKIPGEKFQVGGDNEETNRLVKEMGMAMLVGVFLILIILVLQFDSFLQSFVIVLLIPFSLTGVLLGFWISGTPISFPSMIGIVALAGIIVNDAIILIDKINHYIKAEGREIKEACIEAGKERAQPIAITSITTILGLLPLAFSDPIWEGLGFAIIYGMVFSTILTLLLVPCLLIFFERIWNWLKSWA